MTHFLFPSGVVPAFPAEATVQTACRWLLAVMDGNDSSRRFVASVMIYEIDRGYLTEKQMAALRGIAEKIIKKWAEGVLEAQGATPAAEQTLKFGEVVEFPVRSKTDFQVIE
jgi:hypothetical protein